jgi:hypothetical protein
MGILETDRVRFLLVILQSIAKKMVDLGGLFSFSGGDLLIFGGNSLID